MRGLTITDFAASIYVTISYVYQLIRGEREPKLSTLHHIALTHRVSFEWLRNGKGPMEADLQGPMILSGLAEIKLVGEHQALAADYVAAPLVDGSIACGTARIVDEDVHEWLVLHRRAVAGRSNIVGVRVAGDSMVPTIPDGSIVAIDRADRAPRDLGVYAVAVDDDGDCTIKRLKITPHGYALVPDNPAHRIEHMLLRREWERRCVGGVFWVSYLLGGER